MIPLSRATATSLVLCLLAACVPACLRRRAHPAEHVAPHGASLAGRVERAFDQRPRPIDGPAGMDDTRFVVGGLRAELGPRGVVVSTHRFDAHLIATARLERAWVFVTDDGAIFAGPEFTGKLRAIGPKRIAPLEVFRAAFNGLPSPIGATGWTHGLLGLVVNGDIWTTDGSTVTRAGATPSRASEVAFADAQRGIAALADGSLARTADGGRTWSPVPIGIDLALYVAYDGRALLVKTPFGWKAFGDDNQLAQNVSDVHLSHRTSESAEARVATAYDRAVPELRASRAIVMRDGTRLVATDSHDLVQLDREGRERWRTPLGARDAALAHWGSSALLLSEVVLRSDDGLVWRPIEGLRLPPPEHFLERDFPTDFDPYYWRGHVLRLSDDGRHAMLSGPCGRPPEDSATICAIVDGSQEHHEWRLPVADRDDHVSFRPMHNAQLLFSVTRDQRPDRHFVIDTDTGVVTAVPCAAANDSCDLLDWAGDGRIWGQVAHHAGPESVSLDVVYGPLGGPLEIHSAPAGTTNVALTVRGRGIALSGDYEHAWRTLDAGRTWTPFDPGRFDPRVGLECTPEGCRADRMQWLGWNDSRSVTPPVIEAPAAAPGGSAPTGPSHTSGPITLLPLHCTVADSMVPSPWRAHPSVDHWLWPMGSIYEEANGGAHAETSTLVWDRFGSAIHRADVPSSSGIVARDSTRFLGGDAGALLVTAGEFPELSWARDNDVHTLRGTLLPWNAGWVEVDTRDWLVEPRGDGGVAVLTRAALGSQSPAEALRNAGGLDPMDHAAEADRNRRMGSRPAHILLEVDADGTVTASRGYLATNAVAGLSRVRGQWGRLSLDLDGAVTFAPISGPVTQTLGRRDGPIAPCVAGSADPLAVTATFPSYEHAPLDVSLTGFSVEAGEATVELTPTGACLRSARWAVRASAPLSPVRPARFYDPEDRRAAMIAVESVSGGLEGIVDNGTVRRTIRCHGGAP